MPHEAISRLDRMIAEYIDTPVRRALQPLPGQRDLFGGPEQPAVPDQSLSQEATTMPPKKSAKPAAKTYNDSFDPAAIDAAPVAVADKPAKGKKKAAATAPAQVETSAQQLQLIALDRIDHDPNNARSEAEIEADPDLDDLVESIRQNGLAQPLVVTPNGKRFTTVVGHRRRVACRHAGLKAVNCIVREEMTEAEAVSLQIIENLQRKDLTAIQEALTFERALKTLKWSQQQLADRIGKPQSYVSYRLSLTKLPESIQNRVVAGDLSTTQARDLASLADIPGLLDAFEASYTGRLGHKWGLKKNGQPVVDDDDYDTILAGAIADRMGSMGNYGEERIAFEPTPEQRKLLDVRKVRFSNDHTEEWAANFGLWSELQDAALETTDKGKKPADGQNASDVKPLTKEEQAKRLAQAKAVADKRLYRYIVEWHQRAIYARVPDLTGQQVTLLLLAFSVISGDDRARRERLDVAAEKVYGKKLPFGDVEGQWTMLLKWDREKLRTLLYEFLQLWCETPARSFSSDANPVLIERLAGELGINIAEQWTPDRQFLTLLTTEQLADLSKEWSLPSPDKPTTKKSDLIDHILAVATYAALPKILAKAKAVTLD